MNAPSAPSAPLLSASSTNPNAPPPSYEEATGIVDTEHVVIDAQSIAQHDQDESKKKTAPPVTTQPQPIQQTMYTTVPLPLTQPPPPPPPPPPPADDCCIFCYWCNPHDFAECVNCILCCPRTAVGGGHHHDCCDCDCGDGCCDGCDCDCGCGEGCDCSGGDAGGCDCSGGDAGGCDCDCGDCGDCTIL